MPDLPSGTVTFLFTDIEGSTQRWQQHPKAMPVALERHFRLLRDVIEAHGGAVFKIVGDAVCAAFPDAVAAVTAALTAQRSLDTEPWGATGPLRVRMALHTGIAWAGDGDYAGGPLNRVARLLSAGNGGQILLSAATAAVVTDHLSPEVHLRDLGTHQLKDLYRPEHIFQLVTADLPADFSALTTEASLPPYPSSSPPITVSPITVLSPAGAHRRRRWLMVGLSLLALGVTLGGLFARISADRTKEPTVTAPTSLPGEDFAFLTAEAFFILETRAAATAATRLETRAAMTAAASATAEAVAD